MAIQKTADAYGYSLVREYGGHGLGHTMHEDPFIPNYYSPELGLGPFLRPGMVIAIEPMVMTGRPDILTLADGWGVVSRDHKINAHYENDVLITETGAEILSVDSNVRRHLKERETKTKA
jgi:methionyl aminopeptidase